jgi:hypothetical protein
MAMPFQGAQPAAHTIPKEQRELRRSVDLTHGIRA